MVKDLREFGCNSIGFCLEKDAFSPDFWRFASKLVSTADQETSHLLKEATNNFVLSNATDEDREVKEPMKQKHRWFSKLVL